MLILAKKKDRLRKKKFFFLLTKEQYTGRGLLKCKVNDNAKSIFISVG